MKGLRSAHRRFGASAPRTLQRLVECTKRIYCAIAQQAMRRTHSFRANALSVPIVQARARAPRWLGTGMAGRSPSSAIWRSQSRA